MRLLALRGHPRLPTSRRRRPACRDRCDRADSGSPLNPTKRSRSPSRSTSANALTNEPPADSSSGCTASNDGLAVCAPTITDSASVSTVSNLGFRMRITSGPGSLLASGRLLSFLCARGAPPPRASRASARPAACRQGRGGTAASASRRPSALPPPRDRCEEAADRHCGPPQLHQPWQPVHPC